MNAKVTALVFCLLLGGIAALNFLTPSRLMSENENRPLQQMPEFKLTSVASGSFMEDFDQYVIDQFAFRDNWVGVKTVLERSIGKASSNGVYFGADGYLMEMFDTVDQAAWERNLSHVAAFSQRTAAEAEIPVHTLLIPTATMVLSDKLPIFAPEISQSDLLEEAHRQIPGFVDVSQALISHSDEYIYYRTDHHWTSLGAFYAYNQWREHRGLPSRYLETYAQTVLSDNFYGTTYSKANLYTAQPDTITGFLPVDRSPISVEYNLGEAVTDTIYAESYLSTKDKYSVFLNANQPITKITTQVDNGERLLVIKDSYANTFVQMLLLDYEEIHVVDLRYFKTPILPYLTENGITEVLVLYNLKGFSTDTNLLFLNQ